VTVANAKSASTSKIIPTQEFEKKNLKSSYKFTARILSAILFFLALLFFIFYGSFTSPETNTSELARIGVPLQHIDIWKPSFESPAETAVTVTTTAVTLTVKKSRKEERFVNVSRSHGIFLMEFASSFFFPLLFPSLLDSPLISLFHYSLWAAPILSVSVSASLMSNRNMVPMPKINFHSRAYCLFQSSEDSLCKNKATLQAPAEIEAQPSARERKLPWHSFFFFGKRKKWHEKSENFNFRNSEKRRLIKGNTYTREVGFTRQKFGGIRNLFPRDAFTLKRLFAHHVGLFFEKIKGVLNRHLHPKAKKLVNALKIFHCRLLRC